MKMPIKPAAKDYGISEQSFENYEKFRKRSVIIIYFLTF
jgi:hypothetical protein